MSRKRYPRADPAFTHIRQQEALRWFQPAADHYGLAGDTRAAAIESLMAEPYKAMRCYRAICRSLDLRPA